MKKPTLHVYVKSTATDEMIAVCPITRETVLAGAAVVVQLVNDGYNNFLTVYAPTEDCSFFDIAEYAMQSARSLAKNLDLPLVEHFSFWHEVAA